MALTLVTPPTALPVSREDAKAWCRIEPGYTRDDAVVDSLLAAACRQVESFTGLALGEQVWKLTLDEFSDAIELAKGPVAAIGSFTYLDADGLSQDVDDALWTLDMVSDPAWIVRNSDASWPDTLDAINVVRIEFTCGHSAATLPADLALAVKSLAAHWYDNRTPGEMPEGVRQLLSPYRKYLI